MIWHRQKAMYQKATNVVTVALDTRLTPELLEEGFVRELVSKNPDHA